MGAQTTSGADGAGPSAWTLALDESGRFEGALLDGTERFGWVVGGVLLPGGAEQTERELQGFRQWWEAQGRNWPPHASELPDEPSRATLREQAAEVVDRLR